MITNTQNGVLLLLTMAARYWPVLNQFVPAYCYQFDYSRLHRIQAQWCRFTGWWRGRRYGFHSARITVT